MGVINDDENLVPENTIAIFGYQADKTFPSISSLKGEKQRDWFEKQYYFCLPITFANQYGFVVKSLFDFTVNWDGGREIDSVKITCDDVIEDGVYGNEKQKIYSYFGNGTFSIAHDFTMRTPPGTNIYVTQPPNFYIPAVTAMAALIEADNLVRDFTYTLKITVPNMDIHIKKGDMLAMFLPIPRYYPDSFEIKDALTMFEVPVLRQTLNTMIDHAKHDYELKQTRGGTFGGLEHDEKRALGYYYMGTDPYGNEFKEHQRNPL